jgi:cytochrome c553
MRCTRFRSCLLALCLVATAGATQARNPIRNAFFSRYPAAVNTALDELPSHANHCGVCHFDFSGGGPRNPYGLSVEVGLNNGLSNAAAVAAAEPQDADNDGFSALIEITDTANFANTPTFPGLKSTNVGSVLNVNQADLVDHLTPSGGSDVDPPLVTVTWPVGGESVVPNTTETLTWAATDPSGIAAIDISMSEDGGVHWETVARNLPATSSYAWFVPNLPGAATRIRVQARDAAGNTGHGDSPADFTIAPHAGGVAPTTLRDFRLPGTQPFGAGVYDNPEGTCSTCHGGYSAAVEPWSNWRGSMMGNTMRDPVFAATMVIAEQDAPASGDLCLRCHTPGGWQEGRSTDTSGGMVTAKDRQGVQCDYCHRAVDPIYQPGVSPAVDEAILARLDAPVLGYGNGQSVSDPDPIRRGPYADAQASHQFLDSAFHRTANLCGTCHDVSNPAFVAGSAPGEYVVQELDAPHPDGNKRDMFPVERTFSEWSVSAYAEGGVYAPQFAGVKPGGIVSTCQDCHMADATGRGADTGPMRTDLGVHDLTGGNHFVPDLIPAWFPGEFDQTALNAGKARVTAMLQMAATLEVFESPVGGGPGVTVRVTNETAHKLPSGYPEGRRIWINVRAFDDQASLIYESGAYDPATGTLSHDPDAKIYHIELGTSHRLGAILGIDAGPSFHFVLNDTVFLDNRIPPRGASLAELEAVQSPVVGYGGYQDGQFWDDTVYDLPAGASIVEVALYYQSISKEYVEFLREANTTNTMGQELYDSWVAQGRAAPVLMGSEQLVLASTGAGEVPNWRTALAPAAPNPFNPSTELRFTVARQGRVSLRIFDERGRLVRDLVAGTLAAGEHVATWDGRDGEGRATASGVYMAELRTSDARELRKMTLLK